MGRTSIEWTDVSWPIANGCRRVSPGCGGPNGGGCYAERLAATRLRSHPKYKGLAIFGAKGPRWTGKARLWEPDLTMPLRLRKPSRIFVADMGDLFYEGVSDESIDRVYAVMALAPRHTFQVLTKRPERMLAWYRRIAANLGLVNEAARSVLGRDDGAVLPTARHGMVDGCWPLANVWAGVSVEDQKRADERIPVLLEVPAAVRFLSVEPLLEPVRILGHLLGANRPGDCACGHGHGFTRCPHTGAVARECHICGCSCRRFERARGVGIHWVIGGAESGPRARPWERDWFRTLRDHTVAGGAKFFLKQFADARGRKQSLPHLDGRRWQEIP